MIYRLRVFSIVLCSLILLEACKSQRADLLLTNGKIHTMDSVGTIVQAVAIRDGKVISVGTTDDILFDFEADSIIDLKGKAVYPGFHDAHCHLIGYAQGLARANMTGVTSWEDAILMIRSFATRHEGEWVIGRGWDHTRWPGQQFPTNDSLNKYFPDRPVLLVRIDGHAAVANNEALRRAGIDGSPIPGGYVGMRGSRPNGLLKDNAVDRVYAAIPEISAEELTKLLLEAQEHLLAVGLTTLHEAGISRAHIELIDSLQQKGEFKMRMYAMALPQDMDYWLDRGQYETNRIAVRSFKYMADGALGSRGARLLKPYKDRPETAGFLLEKPEFYKEAAAKIRDKGWQMNTHCIGDSANRLMLRVYAEQLQEKNDLRWRIEHAQVVSLEDIHLFGDYNIWPSVQPSHATSDHRWAEDRIGKERIAGAYAYRSLLDENHKIAFGSDFPVEGINPLNGFYAAVARKDLEDLPKKGFLMKEAVGRDTAMAAMTSWAAESAFMENKIGRLLPGMDADMVVMDRDVLFVPLEEALYGRVKMTLIEGEIVFSEE